MATLPTSTFWSVRSSRSVCSLSPLNPSNTDTGSHSRVCEWLLPCRSDNEVMMSRHDGNNDRKQLVAGVRDFGKLSPDTVGGYQHAQRRWGQNGAPGR